MSFLVLVLGWVIATSLGIAAIVALEPLWTQRRVRVGISIALAAMACALALAAAA